MAMAYLSPTTMPTTLSVNMDSPLHAGLTAVTRLESCKASTTLHPSFSLHTSPSQVVKDEWVACAEELASIDSSLDEAAWALDYRKHPDWDDAVSGLVNIWAAGAISDGSTDDLSPLPIDFGQVFDDLDDLSVSFSDISMDFGTSHAVEMEELAVPVDANDPSVKQLPEAPVRRLVVPIVKEYGAVVDGYLPTDVLLGAEGRLGAGHAANIVWHDMVQARTDEYKAQMGQGSNLRKLEIVREIVKQLEHHDRRTRFLRRVKNGWKIVRSNEAIRPTRQQFSDKGRKSRQPKPNR